MLSVQTAGCAGMERLGVPTRTSLSTPPDDRYVEVEVEVLPIAKQKIRIIA